MNSRRLCLPFRTNEAVVEEFLQLWQTLPILFFLTFYLLFVVPVIAVALYIDNYGPEYFIPLHIAKSMLISFALATSIFSLMQFRRRFADTNQDTQDVAVIWLALSIFSLSATFTLYLFHPTPFEPHDYLAIENGTAVVQYGSSGNQSLLFFPAAKEQFLEPVLPFIHTVEKLPQIISFPVIVESGIYPIFPATNEPQGSTSVDIQSTQTYTVPVPLENQGEVRTLLEYWENMPKGTEGAPLCSDACFASGNGVCEDKNGIRFLHSDSSTVPAKRTNGSLVKEGTNTRPPETIGFLLDSDASCSYGTDCVDCGERPMPQFQVGCESHFSYFDRWAHLVLSTYGGDQEEGELRFPNQFYAKYQQNVTFLNERELPELLPFSPLGTSVPTSRVLNDVCESNADKRVCTIAEVNDSVVSASTAKATSHWGYTTESVQGDSEGKVFIGYTSTARSVSPTGSVSTSVGFVPFAPSSLPNLPQVAGVWCCEDGEYSPESVFLRDVSDLLSGNEAFQGSLEDCFAVCLWHHKLDQQACSLLQYTEGPGGRCRFARASSVLTRTAGHFGPGRSHVSLLAPTHHIAQLPRCWSPQWDRGALLLPFLALPALFFAQVLAYVGGSCKGIDRDDSFRTTFPAWFGEVCCDASAPRTALAGFGLSLGAAVLLAPKVLGLSSPPERADALSWRETFIPMYLAVGIACVLVLRMIVRALSTALRTLGSVIARPLCLGTHDGLEAGGATEPSYERFHFHTARTVMASFVLAPFLASVVLLGEYLHAREGLYWSSDVDHIRAVVSHSLGQQDVNYLEHFPRAFRVVKPIIVGWGAAAASVLLHWFLIAVYKVENWMLDRLVRANNEYQAALRVRRSRLLDWFRMKFMEPDLPEEDVIFMLKMIRHSPRLSRGLGKEGLIDLAKLKLEQSVVIWSPKVAKYFGSLLQNFELVLEVGDVEHDLGLSEFDRASFDVLEKCLDDTAPRPLMLTCIPWLCCTPILFTTWYSHHLTKVVSNVDIDCTKETPSGFRFPSQCAKMERKKSLRKVVCTVPYPEEHTIVIA